MHTKFRRVKSMVLLASVWASSFAISSAVAQSGQQPADLGKAPSAKQTIASTSAPFSHNRLRQSMLASMQSSGERWTYGSTAGIDNLRVQETASGALLRFSYRVLDANKAKALHNERSKPFLIDEKTGAVLQVPDMPKVGELRPKGTPVNGKEYWMVFSNKGFIKPGSRVDVVIGSFRAVGLQVY